MKKAIIIKITKWAKGEVELAKLSTLLPFSSHFFENFKKVGEVGSRVGLAGSTPAIICFPHSILPSILKL